MRLVACGLLAFANAVAAVGNALVVNNSTNTIYAWSVGSSVGPRQAIVVGMCC
jgi:hypothetical protein